MEEQQKQLAIFSVWSDKWTATINRVCYGYDATKEVDIMSKVANVLFPDGRMCCITGVEAYCEKVVSLAGKSLRLMERTRGFQRLSG